MRNKLQLKNHGIFTNFTKISVPEDAYKFVSKLDELISELTTENLEQKLLQIQIKGLQIHKYLA